MLLLPALFQGLVLGLSAAAQPGPYMAYLVAQSLARGFRKSWVAAFAPLISDGPIILLALWVLSQMPPWLERGLNLVSGLFILFLAWGAYRQWRTPPETVPASPPAGYQSLLRAALMNALSPMPYIYWSLVTGPILLAGWRVSPVVGVSFLAGFYLALISGMLLLMALSSAARGMGQKVSRALLAASGVALLGFGLLQLWRAAAG